MIDQNNYIAGNRGLNQAIFPLFIVPQNSKLFTGIYRLPLTVYIG